MNSESQILNVPIEDIIPNRFQPRLTFDEAGLKELAASIKEHGIIQPLVLRRLGDKFEIIAGERRYKASKMAGLTSVPAIITVLDDKKSAEVAIVENVQRRNLTSIEEAKSYKTLLDKGYLTQDELAKRMGLSQSAISNKLRLLSLTEKVQEALMENKISERHARSLLQLEAKDQEQWLEKIISERLTVRELDNRIKNELKNNNEPVNENSDIEKNVLSNTNNIIPVNNVNELSSPNYIEQEKPIPNKFFNFLEDEQANMSVVEPINTIFTENNNEEEIELLDFAVPQDAPISEKEIEKDFDMTIANDIINKAIEELKQENYNVSFEKNEKSNRINYIINIDKN